MGAIETLIEEMFMAGEPEKVVITLDARPKSRTDGRPLRRSVESGALKGYVMHNAPLEGPFHLTYQEKERRSRAEYWSRRKQRKDRLGTEAEWAAPDAWDGEDYAIGREAFGVPLKLDVELEAMRGSHLVAPEVDLFAALGVHVLPRELALWEELEVHRAFRDQGVIP